jgi:hypothetical protein
MIIIALNYLLPFAKGKKVLNLCKALFTQYTPKFI